MVGRWHLIQVRELLVLGGLEPPTNGLSSRSARTGNAEIEAKVDLPNPWQRADAAQFRLNPVVLPSRDGKPWTERSGRKDDWCGASLLRKRLWSGKSRLPSGASTLASTEAA